MDYSTLFRQPQIHPTEEGVTTVERTVTEHGTSYEQITRRPNGSTHWLFFSPVPLKELVSEFCTKSEDHMRYTAEERQLLGSMLSMTTNDHSVYSLSEGEVDQKEVDAASRSGTIDNSPLKILFPSGRALTPADFDDGVHRAIGLLSGGADHDCPQRGCDQTAYNDYAANFIVDDDATTVTASSVAEEEEHIAVYGDGEKILEDTWDGTSEGTNATGNTIDIEHDESAIGMMEHKPRFSRVAFINKKNRVLAEFQLICQRLYAQRENLFDTGYDSRQSTPPIEWDYDAADKAPTLASWEDEMMSQPEESDRSTTPTPGFHQSLATTPTPLGGDLDTEMTLTEEDAYSTPTPRSDSMALDEEYPEWYGFEDPENWDRAQTPLGGERDSDADSEMSPPPDDGMDRASTPTPTRGYYVYMYSDSEMTPEPVDPNRAATPFGGDMDSSMTPPSDYPETPTPAHRRRRSTSTLANCDSAETMDADFENPDEWTEEATGHTCRLTPDVEIKEEPIEFQLSEPVQEEEEPTVKPKKRRERQRPQPPFSLRPQTRATTRASRPQTRSVVKAMNNLKAGKFSSSP